MQVTLLLALLCISFVLMLLIARGERNRLRRALRAKEQFPIRSTQRGLTERESFRVITAGKRDYDAEIKERIRKLVRESGGC